MLDVIVVLKSRYTHEQVSLRYIAIGFITHFWFVNAIEKLITIIITYWW